MRLLKNGVFSDDTWRQVEDDAMLPADGKIIVSFARLMGEDDEHPFPQDCSLGVAVDAGDPIEALEAWVKRLSLIILRIGSFNDGRQMSAARILRTRYGYGGELRAAGDLLPDFYQFMRQVGFDAFEIPQARLSGWSADGLRMSLSYQTDYPEDALPASPIWRARRHRDEAA